MLVSNPAGGMDVCLLRGLYSVRQRSLPRAGHSSSALLQSVMCLRAVVEPDNEEVLAHWGLLRNESNVENITDLYVLVDNQLEAHFLL